MRVASLILHRGSRYIAWTCRKFYNLKVVISDQATAIDNFCLQHVHTANIARVVGIKSRRPTKEPMQLIY